MEVIFDVDIKSPMYFCRNLLLSSSLSCSSFTASMRLKISSKDCWSNLACLLRQGLVSMFACSLKVAMGVPTRSVALSHPDSSSPNPRNSAAGSWLSHHPRRKPHLPPSTPRADVLAVLLSFH